MTDPFAEPPHMKEYGKQHPTFLLTPERARATIETEEGFSTRATRWLFVDGQE